MFCIRKYFIEYRSLSTDSAPNCYDYMRFPIRLWLTYGSLRWTSVVWRSDPVNLSEPARTHITQNFTYIGVYYFINPSEGKVWFWYSVEVNQFLSYNLHITEGRKMRINVCYSELYTLPLSVVRYIIFIALSKWCLLVWLI